MLRRWRSGDIGTDTGRIAAFTDGVMAIAITLLVLNIKVPAIPRGRVTAELPGALWDALPSIGSYALSFIVVGIYWMSHHRIFTFIIRYDRRLLWLNTLFLLSVSFIPFASELNGAYGTDRVAFAIYALNLVLTGVMLTTIWLHASQHHRLIAADLDPRLIRYLSLRGLILPIIALVGIGISFVSPEYANFAWLLAWPLSHIFGRAFGPEEREEDADELGARDDRVA